MQDLTDRLSLGAAGLALVVLVCACNQDPSFKDSYSSDRIGTGDVNHADATAKGPNGEDPGEDPITGDIEPQGESDGNGADDVADSDGEGDTDGDGDGDGDSDGGTDGTLPSPRLTREMTFPSHRLLDASVTKNLDNPYLTQEITLQRLYTNQTRQQTQVIRPVLVDNFEQGNSGATHSEQFAQVANRLLDILVVIDNSGSMDAEQNNLAGKLEPLLGYVSGTDWQIGFTTTDPNQTCLRKLIKKGDADQAEQFQSAVAAGISGSNNERGILQAVRSLSGTCLSQPWIRPDSTLAVLFVTDEDNCSDGTECPGKNYASASYLYDYLAQIRVPGQNARVYGILWHPSQSQAQCATGYNKAVIYSQLITQTGGTWGSICDADYAETLSQISQNIQSVLNSKFTLRYQPEPGSTRVFLGATELVTGFTVTGKVVDINPAPADGTVVTVTYRYGAQPILSTFPLRYKPLADRVAVTVNGAQINPSSYSVRTATPPAILFQAPPAERGQIVVTYTRDVPLNTQYLLGDQIKPSSMKVRINDVETANFTVNESLGLVTFAPAPAEGSTIVFTYAAVGDPVLKYAFAAPDGTPQDLVAYDGVTAAPVRVTYAAGFVTVNGDDYVEGRRVVLRYDNVARQLFDVILPNVPVTGSVRATGGAVNCTAANLGVNGMTVSVDQCGFADDVSEVTVGYQYVAEAYAEFVFAEGGLPPPGEFQEWKVWVNGTQRSDFSRDGNRFRFPSPLSPGSTVKIQLIQLDK